MNEPKVMFIMFLIRN